MKDLKVIFMGTPLFSVPILKTLIENCSVIGVVTQPDNLVDKEKKVIYSPIKKIALKNNIKLFQPNKISDNYSDILSLNPDIIITCAYGQFVPKELLEKPKYGCINIHASLLPKLRGGAPIHHAIMQGHEKTGITIIYLTEKMDAGPIISQKEINILPTENVGDLHDRLSIIGKDLLMETLPNIMSGNINPVNQKEVEVTYANNIKPEDELIDFSKTTKEIYNHIRGLNPWPGAYTILNGKRYKIWESRMGNNVYSNKLNGEIVSIYDDGIGVKTNNGEIIFNEIQIEGKKRIKVRDFLNGIQDKQSLIGKIFE